MPLTRIRTDDLLSGSVANGTLNATAITGHAAATSADDADLVLIYDNTSSALRKMTRANFTSGITGDVTAVSAGAGLQGGGMPYDETEQFSEEIVQTPTGMEELWQLRDQINTPRGMRSETIGGVVGLALGGDPMFPRKRGAIHGPGGPKEDKIPARLSDGEFVMTSKAVDNAGGPHAMYNLMNRLDPDSSRKPKGIA